MTDGLERRRMSRAARREQLIVLGVELVGASSFDAVSTDDVAAAAGISRGLLFHYFPTKRDFQVAVAERGADDLLAATAPPTGASPVEQLRAGVEGLLDHVAAHPDAYLSLVRGTASGDAALRAVADRTRAALVERVLDGLGLEPRPDPVVVLAVRGWVAASEEVVVTWLAERAVDRATVVTVVVDGLLLQLGALLPEGDVARLLAIDG